ncbi:Poly-beta-1,6-N-acetyl-D-glucosamine synthase [Candidatus Brocadiaceae bacterium B188]|nr:Poly-beta-1,6-N-acetyl-D-glucosamine synthase [Candidatus Brocadiaceae bacterium B188]
MTHNLPFVSLIIPIFNEKRYIRQLLHSLLQQDYPKDRLEILLIDGRSEDGTREEINKIMASSREFSRFHITVLDNPKRIVPCALNIGIKEAKGDFIIRMDAHSAYAPDYVSKCVEWLGKKDIANVGGPITSLPGGNSFIAKSICMGLSHAFGVGNSKFRTSQKAEYVDTVTFGAWPRKTFKDVGLFDERLIRNQDIEFNARIRKNGGLIYLTPEIRSYYHCRDSIKKLWKQNFENGKWVVYTKVIAPYTLSWRHFAPFVFVTSLISSAILCPFSIYAAVAFLFIAGSYSMANLFFSFRLACKNGFRYLFTLPVVFATLHFSYGLGSIRGLLTLKRWLKK